MHTYPLDAEAEEGEEKAPYSKYDALPLNDKRKLYKCGKDFVTLDKIQSWSESISGKQGSEIHWVTIYEPSTPYISIYRFSILIYNYTFP